MSLETAQIVLLEEISSICENVDFNKQGPYLRVTGVITSVDLQQRRCIITDGEHHLEINLELVNMASIKLDTLFQFFGSIRMMKVRVMMIVSIYIFDDDTHNHHHTYSIKYF